MNDTLGAWAAPLRTRVDAWLVSRFDDAWPQRFQHACVYPLQTGGKRMRALLACAAAESVGGEIDDAVLGAAGAVEMVHGYSLVHDDLPAMDDDDERRGRPTVHRAFDEATGSSSETQCSRLRSGASLGFRPLQNDAYGWSTNSPPPG